MNRARTKETKGQRATETRSSIDFDDSNQHEEGEEKKEDERADEEEHHGRVEDNN